MKLMKLLSFEDNLGLIPQMSSVLSEIMFNPGLLHGILILLAVFVKRLCFLFMDL